MVLTTESLVADKPDPKADAANAAMTASAQWLERTLDDSANRRVSLPEGFLCADAVLRLMINVTGGIVVNEKVIRKTVEEYLPFIATENIMMEAVKRGGDRQKIHEIIRRCSMAATSQMKNGGECDLVARLCDEKELGLDKADLSALLQPELYIGRCEAQVTNYISKIRVLIAGSERISVDIEN
jgi:adenylosuccinate lyase